jgi:maltose alpha-D-glucosyltransferase/alpha-amylase
VTDIQTKTPPPGRPALLWYKDAVIYQLHIKAFADSNADGIGDFPGLIAKLPYLKELGASAVWLLPFYPSPLRDDGYDIADYKGIHPSYGTMRDFRAFVKAAHKLDLRVITELVINHTSDIHPWFERARKAPAGSALRNWYVWSDTPERYDGTRIIFTDTEKSNWSWDAVAKQYYWHRFFSHQPDLNFDNPQVFDAIADVMRFWFDAGVDGMRLDAVPYLCEREGTNNENLPETHAVLKRLRAILDAEYPDRFLLAEANQWPEDVAQYFGDGDECHMAFHFPLMPRMFMSIAEEDRYPIYDIMRQTPAIPDNCQWAMFLRNHDELTLEMVTDRERAFMYRVYATEARARVNVGIRRRLAPLMENDRRRIELMTSLLLSMPGTPIVYYGDEIGMGDNIYLGDRDGVRTPMQWSGDRNGGFSTADTQRLFLPAIMDPVYGYPAVNVEAQERSPSSLLNWLKRLIAVRQAHTIFGRGTITFIYPENRKVAAYLREHEGEVVLCVANLARTPQAVSLDLSRFAGRVPVEMIGWSPFPKILDDRYVLTLPGHAFYWFSLSDTVPNLAEETQPVPLLTPEFMTLVLPHGRDSITHEPNRTLLEQEVVPPYLAAVHAIPIIQDQRPDVRFVDAIALGKAGDTPLLALFAAKMGYGDVLWNALPLEISYDDGTDRGAAVMRAAIARARTGPHEALLIDASGGEATWFALERALRDAQTLPGTSGKLVARSTWSLANLEFTQGDSIRRPVARGHHISAVVGETMLVTLFRRSPAGVNAEVEFAQYLHDAGFAYAPPLLGTFCYESNDGEHIDIGLARRFILNRGDAWEVTQTFLQRFLERRRTTPVAETNMSPGTETETAGFALQARNAGMLLADLHLTLARESGNAQFGVEDVTQADRDGWASAITRRAAYICRTKHDDRLLPIIECESDLTHAIENAGRIDNGRKIRIHGDFHLARVLVTESDLLIVDSGAGDDFRPPAERRQKRPALFDVARMLRSFDAAASAALRDVARDRTEDPNRFAGDLRLWVKLAADAFCAGYAERTRGTALDTGDASSYAQQLVALALYDSVEALAVAIAEKSASLDFYASHLAALLK